jgi:hypothetical protein
MKIAFHNATYYLPMNPKPTFDGAKWPSKDSSKPTYSFHPFHIHDHNFLRKYLMKHRMITHARVLSHMNFALES